MAAMEQAVLENRVKNGLELPLMEAFYTIQGEGIHSGKPAFFIRLGGCDVGCHWCDVKESWDAGNHEIISIEKIAQQAINSPSKIVVITGGEPAMYNLQPLTELLVDAGKELHIETSGAYEVTGLWHWICFSPKKFKKPVSEIYAMANELKIVVFNKSDLDWAKQHAQLVSDKCELSLQPEWGKATEITPVIIDFVKREPRWRISLQTHKYMNIP